MGEVPARSTVPAHYHDDNRCCFCGAEDDHECVMCPDYDGGVAMGMATAKQAEPTARPWLLVTAEDGDVWIGTESGDDRITVLEGNMGAEADASNFPLIVRAVNAHDALVEAAQMAEQFFLPQKGGPSIKAEILRSKLRAALIQAD